VSLPELASLGVFHGTLARIRRILGREMHVELRQLKRDPARRDSLLSAPLVVKHAWPRDVVKLVLASVVAGAMIIALATGGPAEGDSTLVAAASTVAVPGSPPKTLKHARHKSPPARAINKPKSRKRVKRARKRAKRRKRRR
jgi:hypothetical protein